MKSLAVLLAAQLLAFCDFQAGPHMYVHGAARAGAPSGSAVITVTSSDIATTLAVVQQVAAAHGFHRDPRWQQPDLLAAFVPEYTSTGSQPGCFVYHRAQRGVIEVSVTEWGQFHPGDIVAAIDADLFSALQARFGARVTRHEKA